MDITLYFVGTDDEDAREGIPFDSQESAESFQADNPWAKIYSVTATVNFDTIKEV
jgi:hypothetical protein